MDIFPPTNLQYNAQTKDFTATTNIAGLQMNIDYFIRYVNRPGTPYYNGLTAPATVGDYVATFELSHVNLLKYFIDVIPIKQFTITKAPLTITVNNTEKTYGETKSLQREGFTMSMNPLFGGDKVYELEMLCDALPATAEVAHYPITATQAIGMGVSNYDIQFAPGNFIVHPKAITVSAINNTKTYGTEIIPTGNEFYIAPNALVGTDAINTVDLQSLAFAANANIGNHAITISNATGHRLSNYNISYNNATATVDKKNIELNILPIIKTYGESYTFTGKEFNTDESQLIDTDSINTLQLASAGSATKANVGDYAIAISGITGNRLNNYNIKTNTANFKVNPKPLSIIANSSNKAFGNSLAFDGTEYNTDVPLVVGDNISFVMIKSNGAGNSAPIGTYDIVPSSAHGVGSLNYLFSYINGTLSVVKKDITADIFPPTNLSYNAQAKIFTATTSDNNLQLHSHYVIRYFNADNSYNSTTAPSNAGEYTAVFELTSAGALNYELAHAPTQSFVITKANISVKANDAIKTYGESWVLSNDAFEASLKPLYGSDMISAVEFNCMGLAASTLAGDYDIDISKINGSGLDNYQIAIEKGNFKVLKRNLRIQALDVSKVYGDNFIATGKEFFVDPISLVNNDTVQHVTVASVGFSTLAGANTYNITISNATGRGLENYNLQYNNATLYVTRKNITVSAATIAKTYGDTYNFNGNEIAYDKTQLIGTDSIASAQLQSVATIAKAPVGDHQLSIVSLDGYRLENYNIKLLNGTFRVTQKNIAIRANNTTKHYGELLSFTGKEFSTDQALIAGDSIYFVVFSSAGIEPLAPVGNYSIFPSMAYGNAVLNYNFSYLPGQLSIAQQTLSASIAPPEQLMYNAQPKTGTATVSIASLKQNEHFFVRYTDKNNPANSSYAAPTNVGIYSAEIELSYATSINYTLLNNAKIDFEIAKAPLSIRANNATKQYGQALSIASNAFTTSLLPLYGSDKVLSIATTCAGLTDTCSVGNYSIAPHTATGNGLNNYAITYANGVLNVQPKTISVKAANASKVYGDVLSNVSKGFIVNENALLSTDSITSITTLSNGQSAKATVGNYPLQIVAAQGKRLSNYTLQFVDGNLQVTQKNIAIRANNTTKHYGELLSFTGKEFSTDQALIAGDSIYFVVFSSAGIEPLAPVGNYSIFPSMAYGNAVLNYNFSYLPGQLSIAQQTLSASIAPPEQLMYNAQPKTGTATLSIGSLKQNEHFFVRYTDKNNPANSSYAAPTNVGIYSAEIELSYATSINYTLLNNAKIDFEIAKAPLSIRANNATKQYGQALSIASDAFTTSLLPLYGSDKVLSIATTCAGLTDTCSVGNYSIAPHTATGNGLNNYAITYANGVLNLQPKTINVKAANASKVYGDVLANVSKGFIVNENALLSTDSITSITTQSPGQSANATVGNYPLQIVAAQGKRLSNYTLQFIDGNLQVLPKSLTVLADTLSKEYGSEYILKGTEFTVDLSELIGNDKINTAKLNSIATQKTASVGEYTINITDVSGYGLENYNIKFQNATFKVRPRNITITANNINKEYGDVYSFTGNEFSIDRPLLNNDNIAFVFMTSNGATENAAIGSYPIVAAMASGNGNLNYNINYVVGQMTVAQKQLNIQINSGEKEYGQADPTIGFKVFDVRGIEYLPSMISGKPQRDAGEKPSEYSIKRGSIASNQNYNLNIIEGKLTIKKALPQISASFSNDTQKTIISYITGTPNANIPTGKLNVSIPSCGMNISTNVNQGISNCMLMELPADEVLAHIHYAGDENYLPISRSMKLYAIRYHSNGGDLLNPITHFDGNETIRPETPTRQQRYRFEGWYENPNFEGNPLQRIVLGTYRNIDLYAKWVTSFDDLSVVVLFNQVLAVANPLKREFLERATYRWFKNGQPMEGNKQYIGFENYVPTGEYKVEIYYDGNIPIVIELKHTATVSMSKIFPNPAKVNAPVQIESAHWADENTQIELYSSDGKRQTLSNIEKHGNSYTINTLNKAGIYVVRIVQNGITLETHKLIIEDK